MNTARPPLKTLDSALAELLAQALPLSEVDDLDTFEADGRVLARDLVSELNVPPRDNSAMDGYALRCADVAVAGTTLRVAQRIAAGAVADQALASGEAARIFTGAQLPPGADAVVMQEDCQSLDDGSVRINTVPVPGQNVRRAGEDVRLGATVLPRGTRLNPAALGLAASIGLSRLPVARRPRVALFSTGDELVMPGTVMPAQLPPGAIYNSNRFFLRALLQRLGCMVTDCGIVPDQRDATLNALRQAAEGHDLILSSGGVSVGEEDHVKPAVQSLGSLDLWQVAIKPGKPFAYGKVRAGQGQAHFIGLPGNPVSSYVTFLLLVRPFLLRLQGVPEPAVAPTMVTLPAHFEWARADKRREFLRARRNESGGVDLHPQQGSGVLTSVAWADGLVDNPPERRIAHGDPVRFIAFSEFMV
ncbi:gephyrin-like molybdotransferase Glp [Hylemonella sp. W303a]|uniref:molybdopterin molybdotransferase MoeA n=1 Tax=Hylemonella sp. W303a TaxID=3389873 RepID=UPI00396B3A1E